MPVTLLTALAVVAALLVPPPAVAGTKIVVGGGVPAPRGGVAAFRGQIPAHRHPHAARPVPRTFGHRQPLPDHRGPSHGFSARRPHVTSGPIYVFPAPVYIAPRQCTTPGYWSYAWVPQHYSYPTWVPGHFAEDGTWIDGYYEARYYGSGYWQPYWIEGGTTAC